MAFLLNRIWCIASYFQLQQYRLYRIYRHWPEPQLRFPAIFTPSAAMPSPGCCTITEKIGDRPQIFPGNQDQHRIDGNRIVRAATVLLPGDPDLYRLFEAQLSRDLIGQQGGPAPSAGSDCRPADRPRAFNAQCKTSSMLLAVSMRSDHSSSVSTSAVSV
jgi:hypothetical protein